MNGWAWLREASAAWHRPCVCALILVGVCQHDAGAQSPKVLELYKGRDYPAVIAESKKVLLQYPDDAPSHYYLGLAYSGHGDYSLAKEQFEWVLTHSANPDLRVASDRAVTAIENASAARGAGGGGGGAGAAPVGSAAGAAPRSGKGAAPTIGESQPGGSAGARVSGARQAGGSVARLTADEKAKQRLVLESEAAIADGKLKILKQAEDECKKIDERLQHDVQAIRNEEEAVIASIPIAYEPVMSPLAPRIIHPDYIARVNSVHANAAREIDRLKFDAEAKKRRVNDEAQKKAAAWESSMDYIRSEMKHPGKNIQIMAKHSSPYVRDYVTYGDSEDDYVEPREIVPLRAKAQKLVLPQK